ncbi:hypothetical protein M9458_053927, partial [Cirrhinus mrigala]
IERIASERAEPELVAAELQVVNQAHSEIFETETFNKKTDDDGPAGLIDGKISESNGIDMAAEQTLFK